MSVQNILIFVLKYIFNKNKFSLSFILALLFIVNSTNVIAQGNNHSRNSKLNKKISGIVVDAATNESIIGATVLLMESKGNDDVENQAKQCCHGVATGLDGDFTLKVNPEIAKFIKVSYIGYKSQEIEIDYTGKPMKILLHNDCEHLNEVVVMGYATTTKEKSTGAISTVRESTLVNSPTDNPIAALQGRVPGVLITQSSGIPGGETNIQIRGRSTFGTGTTSTDPLFVIDGVPYSNSSMTTFNQGIVGHVDPLALLNSSDIERIDFLKDADATAIYGSRGANGVVIITTKKGHVGKTKISISADMGLSTVPKTMEFLETDEYLSIRKEAFEADGITPTVDNAYDLLSWNPNTNTDWHDVMLGNTAKSHNVQASVSGGNQSTQFILSGGYNTMNSVVLDMNSDKYQRITGRLNVQHKSENEKFNVNASISYSSLLLSNRGQNPALYLRSIPNMPAYEENGDVYWLPNDDGFSAPARTKHSFVTNRFSTMTSSASLSYKVYKNLLAKVDFGFTRTDASESIKYENKYYNPYNTDPSTINRHYMIDSEKEQWTVEPQFNYSHRIADGTLTALAGLTFESLTDSKKRIWLDNFPLTSLMDNANAAGKINSIYTYKNGYRFNSIFARAGYDWKLRYFANATFRRDGSSRFHSENQFGNFWSIAGAWIFSREEFFKDESGIFSYGKIRSSYGTTGSDAIGDYGYLSTYAFSSTDYNGVPGSYPDKLANENFGWEENNKFEVALELGFFDRKLDLDIAYYHNLSSNQLVSYPLPSQTGFTSYRANLDALVLNKGLEISVNSTNVDKGDFKWETYFNITIPKNVLLEFPGLKQSTYNDNYEIDKPLSVEWVYEFDKIDRETGIPIMVNQNDDDVINDLDKVFKGDSEPKYYGGLGNTLAYKGFNLDFFFQFNRQPVALGYQDTYWYPLGMLYNYPKELAQDYWTPENKDASRPGITTTSSSDLYNSYRSYYTESDAMFTDASYIRLKNVALSYTIPSKWSEHINVSSLKVYVNAQNLWTYTNFFGWDPETETAKVSPLRTVTFGLNIVI